MAVAIAEERRVGTHVAALDAVGLDHDVRALSLEAAGEHAHVAARARHGGGAGRAERDAGGGVASRELRGARLGRDGRGERRDGGVAGLHGRARGGDDAGGGGGDGEGHRDVWMCSGEWPRNGGALPIGDGRREKKH